jgi:hypothetical protein
MANLRLSILDVEQNPLDDTVDIVLKHMRLTDTRTLRSLSAKKRITITDLNADQSGIYQVQVFPLRHHPVGQFATVSEGATADATFVCPVLAKRVTGIQAPDFAGLPQDLQDVISASKTVEGSEGISGQPLYDSLDAPRKAGLLNIYFKMKHTVFASGKDVFSFVTDFTRFRGDRFFANVKKELRDETKNSQATNLFQQVDDSLHTPSPGFQLVDSYKTPDHFGNLQLTFMANPTTLQFRVDADIDDAQGIEHIFQVLDHIITRGDTNPFDIHEILIASQRINPGYTLIV